MEFQKELDVARDAARRAGEMALRYFSQGLSPVVKADLSPVTQADRDAELLISQVLEESFPGDGLLGEEGAEKEARSGRRWIVDPIDGTRDFIRGIPTWSVMMALESAGEVVAAVCHLPALGDTYYASRGQGAYRNGERIAASSVSSTDAAVLCVNGLNGPLAGRLAEWMPRFWAVRSFGGCLDAMMIASGRVDAWIEPTAKPWDLAPLKVIIEEAGGRFFNFDGGASIYGGSCGACAPGLEREVRLFLGLA